MDSLLKRFKWLVTFDVALGAITPLYAGTTPAAGELNGKVGKAFLAEDLPSLRSRLRT